MMGTPVSIEPVHHHHRSGSSNDELKEESKRLETFSRWPTPLIIRPETLARFGFYYTGARDIVKCYFCLVEIGSWERTDDAASEHLRWSRHCPLMARRQTNNVPLNANFLNEVPQPAFDTVGVRSQQASHAQQAAEEAASRSLRLTDVVPAAEYNRQALAKEVEKFKERAKCPSYAEFEQRLKTFDGWPIALPQIPEQLVEAGFVYTGESDLVACFSCGGQLKGWVAGDDPWKEHAKYYEDCHYLKQRKTRAFIENCKAQKTQQVAEPSKLPVGKDNGRESSEASEDEKRSEPAESKLCKVCYENEYNTVFMPCGHVVACRGCADSAQSCLLCNEPFSNVFRVHIVE